jgi:hypothetical protein
MMNNVIFGAAVVSLAACGYGYETRTTTITGAPMITSGPAVGEGDLSRTMSSISERLATEVCARQEKCGRATDATSCLNATIDKAKDELMRWDCSPAATRARIEECLAGIDEESCESDLTAPTRKICPPNVACGPAGVGGGAAASLR